MDTTRQKNLKGLKMTPFNNHYSCTQMSTQLLFKIICPISKCSHVNNHLLCQQLLRRIWFSSQSDWLIGQPPNITVGLRENHDWLLWWWSLLLLRSRLCNDKRLAEEVVRLEGLGRLVELCKNESERVGSDGVLVACLAAVRKIAAAVGPDKFKNLDATELVEPRLLDSFLIFSSRNESFV